MSYLRGDVDSVEQMDPLKAAEVVAQYSAASKKDGAESASKVPKPSKVDVDASIDVAKPERTDDEKAINRKRKIGILRKEGGPESLVGADGFEMASLKEMNASKKQMTETRKTMTAVADRVSVLRNPKADYSFVIGQSKTQKGLYDVLMDKKKAAESSKESSSTKKVLAAMNTVMKPIIIVPSAFGSILNSTNAKGMLADSKYIALEEAKAQGMERVTEQTILRKLPGSMVELPYKLIDNPVKLADEDWKAVVAVFATGQAWQFKGWKWSEPRQLFANVLGVHLCLDDTAISENILQWNCKVLKINRSKRHTDAIAMNKFWEHLDQFVKIYRPELQKEVDHRKNSMKQ